MERYPNGMSSFESIRMDNMVYVDKTGFISRMLETKGKYYFLARPRRFGKSLFTSTLEAFFLGKRELFKGLCVDSINWDWKNYPVFRIDFAPSAYHKEEDLEIILDDILSRYEAEYDIVPSDNTNIYQRFKNLILTAQHKTGLGVVVLVDEYEKPVVDNLDNDELREINRTKLAGFYSVLKALDKNLKFVFLTGVTKFGQMSVFSGLNNLRDISLSRDYGAICGITEDELIENFQDGIQGIAEDEETDFAGALRLLKQNYDGYHFCDNCPDIYNPYSIVYAMAERRIDAYWATSGVPTLLAKALTQKRFNLKDLNEIKATSARLLGVNNQFNDPVALFYQTGYLTIKSYIKKIKTFILGYPNREVEAAFFDYLLPVYSNTKDIDTKSVISEMGTALYDGNPEKAISILKSFSADFTYDVLNKIKIEQHFEDIIYIILKSLLPFVADVKAEDRTSDGRTDILIKTDEYIYIIELKIDSTAEEAYHQIRDKEYDLPYRHDPRKVYLIGINFSTEKRRIDDYTIKKV